MDFNSIPVVAIAISIIICWSLFALFCSFVHEALTQIKAERGRFMKTYLFKQFYDQPNGVNWAAMLYMHGSIDLLTRAVNKPTSDIDSRLFAETLIEVVGKAHITQVNKNDFAEQLTYKSQLLNDFKAATLSLQQSDVVNFFQQSLNSAELCRLSDGTPDEAAIYKCLVDQIERWYNKMMERLSLWYKKKTKLRLFMLGTVLAILVNVDSIALFKHFTAQPASRKAMMNYYEANAQRLTALAHRAESSDSAINYRKQLEALAIEMDSVAKSAALPVGWEHNLFNAQTWRKARAESRDSPLLFSSSGSGVKGILMAVWSFFCGIVWLLLFFFCKLPGFVLSGFAASAGAPFWFDVLKKAYSTKPQKAS
ncbi:MAG TPA: hypothetical protein PL009_06045 [Flavipsychrobacter sp.]|nr:hypothetical protein [Flavipsychrobacter sp.]